MSVWTAQTIGSRTYLGVFGRVTGLTWETTLPGGDRSAAWNLRTPSLADVAVTQQGLRCGITIGGQDVWTGDLTEPQPSADGRQFSADGSSVELTRYFAASDPNVWKLTTNTGSVFMAQSRGMRIASGTLYDAPYGQSSPNDGSKRMDQVVNEVADLLGITWQVNSGTLSMFSYPTVPTYTVLARDQGSRSLQDYVTRMIVRYNNGSIITSVTVNGDQSRGTREDRIDLSSSGTLTAAQATVLGAAALKQVSGRTRFSSPLTVGPYDVLNAAGQPVDPLTLRAGCVVSVAGLDVARGGEPDGMSPTVLIGSVVCDYDSRSAVLTPFDFTGINVATALAGGFTRARRSR